MLVENLKNNIVCFSTVNYGEICCFENEYYISIPILTDSNGDNFNVINLQTGQGYYIRSNEHVTCFNSAKVIIK